MLGFAGRFRRVTLPATNTTMTTLRLLIAVFCFAGGCATPRGTDWRNELDRWLAAFGHRNIVAMVDSVCPQQAKHAVHTLVTGADQFEVLRLVFDRLKRMRHVRPAVAVDEGLALIVDLD